MQTNAAPGRTLLLRSAAVFHPRQSAVAGKNLRVTDTFTDNESAKVLSAALRADVSALLRELASEWDRHAALYPEAAADGWLGLLMNRARLLRAEIEGNADESRNS